MTATATHIVSATFVTPCGVRVGREVQGDVETVGHLSPVPGKFVAGYAGQIAGTINYSRLVREAEFHNCPRPHECIEHALYRL